MITMSKVILYLLQCDVFDKFRHIYNITYNLDPRELITLYSTRLTSCTENLIYRYDRTDRNDKAINEHWYVFILMAEKGISDESCHFVLRYPKSINKYKNNCNEIWKKYVEKKYSSYFMYLQKNILHEKTMS